MSIFSRPGFEEAKSNDVEELRIEWDDLQTQSEVLNQEVDKLMSEIEDIEMRQHEIDKELSYYSSYSYEDMIADKAYDDAKADWGDEDED